jgi:hypothetical protein
MYNVPQNMYSVAIEPCFEMGAPIEVLYLSEISMNTFVSNPSTGEVNFNISGALPEADGSNFAISNVQPSNAIVNSNSIANNGNLVISNLANTEVWSVDITDDAGSTISFTNEYVNINTENSLQISVFPTPALNEIYVNGITEPTVIEIYAITGKKLIQSQLDSDGQIDISTLPKGATA